MARLNKKMLFILTFGLLLAFGFALAFSSCGGGDDDDSRGGDDDDSADDDSTDDDTGDCERSCLDSWKDEYIACLETLISCLDTGGDAETCLNNAANCISTAESNMCVCGTNCNSDCLSALCTCRDGCTAGDLTCFNACFDSFSSCASWFDSTCYNNCYSQLQSGISSCISAQDYSACYTCINTYSSCVDGCY